ncbi:MAG: DUF1489 family protein [Alphaproteobacteria bacterium]|nr:DUF1489 family protein [Alphaproteobacteria bacterium]
MTLHLIKLCVGVDRIDELARFQRQRKKKLGRVVHWTTMMPKRVEELLDGGSLYWVIKGAVTVRQRLIGIERVPNGPKRVALVLSPRLVRTMPQPRRPHQGWRYLDPADAPADLPARMKNAKGLPPKMLRELAELGLL